MRSKRTPPAHVCGVYVITHGPTRRAYVGSSLDIRKRWIAHRRALTRGVGLRALQQDWNAHGPTGFKLTILEVITQGADLIAAEQRWLDRFLGLLGAASLYNVRHRAWRIADTSCHARRSSEPRAYLNARWTRF